MFAVHLEGAKYKKLVCNFIKDECTRCPKKKCELLLLLQVVIHTLFWDTLYLFLKLNLFSTQKQQFHKHQHKYLDKVRLTTFDGPRFLFSYKSIAKMEMILFNVNFSSVVMLLCKGIYHQKMSSNGISIWKKFKYVLPYDKHDSYC